MKLLTRAAVAAAFVVAGAGLALTPGCSKEEPTGKAGKADKEDEGDDEAEDDDQGDAPKPAAKKVMPAADLATTPSLAMPEDVLGVVGISSFARVVEDGLAIVNRIAPGQAPPSAPSLALEGMKAGLGLTDITWLDQTKPIRFFTADPKTHEGKGQTLVLPITNKDAVLASLKPEAAKGADGHAATFEHEFKKMYVDFVDGHAVISDGPAIFGKHQGFITGTLLPWKPARMIVVQAHLDNLNRVFGAEIDEAKQQLTQMLSQMAQDPNMPDSKEVLELEIAMVFALLETSSRASVSIWPKGDDVMIALGVRPKAGTALETFTKTIAGKTNAYADAVPAQTWFGATANMDTRNIKSLRDLSRKSMKMYGNLLQLDEGEKKKLDEIVDRLNDQSTGEATVAVYQDGTFPMAMDGLMSAEDSAEARKVYSELIDLLYKRGFALLKQKLQADGTEIPPGVAEAKSFTELVKVVGGLLGAFGVKLDVVARDADGVKVDGLVFEADWSKLPVKDEEPELHDILTHVVGNKIQVAFAFKGKQIGFAFGPNGLARAADLVNGKRSGGEPTLTRASKGNALAMTVRMDLAMKALSFIPDLKPMMPVIESLPAERSFTMTAASDAAETVFTLGVPTDVVAGLAKLGQ